MYSRNKFDFWTVHGIMNTLGLLQSKGSPKGFALSLQETRSIYDSINRPNIKCIADILRGTRNISFFWIKNNNSNSLLFMKYDILNIHLTNLIHSIDDSINCLKLHLKFQK